MIEQVLAKRDGVGLRGHDPELAWEGYTLYAPQGNDGALLLLDMRGEVTREWMLPLPASHAYMTGDRLFVNARTPEESERFISKQPWKSGAVLEVDWHGNILWELRHPDHHHDAIPLRNGNMLLLCLARLPDDVAARVQGGRPGSEHESGMYADYLVEMTRDGAEVWRWDAWEHLDPEADGIASPHDGRHEWTHGNAIFELPDGDILISFRNISTVAIISRASGDIVWKLGAPPLAQQHAPTALENGNILIFDNGTHRLDHGFPYSRAIEVDRATMEIVWSYQEAFPTDFFSPHISNAQRLPNGNTQICEGSRGRFFEVTHEGIVVWEYVNPRFGAASDLPPRPPNNHVYRAYRYSPEEVARLRDGGS